MEHSSTHTNAGGLPLLAGKSAFITGGSRGIGCATVLRFLEHGASHVAYLSRHKSEKHADMEALAKRNGGRVVHFEGSVDDEQIVKDAIAATAKDAGALDIAVNNAGITRDKFIIGMSREDWDQVLSVNLIGAFFVCKAATSIMAKQRSGSIINISSIVGVHGNAGQTNYSASKAGLIGLTKSLAKEIAKRSVRVNAVAPGFIETDMTDAISEMHREKLQEYIPMARIGTSEEVADACVFLASDLSRYVTGQVLSVCGGMGV